MPKNFISVQDVENSIKQVQYHEFPGSKTTVCCVTLQNGYNVLGESHCVDPENFDKRQGEGFALEDAKKKIVSLLGFILQQRLHDEALLEAAYNKFEG